MMAWIVGAALGLAGLLGLLVASRAHDGALYYVGLAVFAAAVALIFTMIVRATGRPVAREDEFGPPAEP